MLKRSLGVYFVPGPSGGVDSAARRLKEISQWEETYARLSAYVESSDHDVRYIGRTPEDMDGELFRKGLILVRDDQVH